MLKVLQSTYAKAAAFPQEYADVLFTRCVHLSPVNLDDLFKIDGFLKILKDFFPTLLRFRRTSLDALQWPAMSCDAFQFRAMACHALQEDKGFPLDPKGFPQEFLNIFDEFLKNFLRYEWFPSTFL